MVEARAEAVVHKAKVDEAKAKAAKAKAERARARVASNLMAAAVTGLVADMAIKGADATAAGLKTFWDGNRRRGRSSRPPPSSCILHS